MLKRFINTIYLHLFMIWLYVTQVNPWKTAEWFPLQQPCATPSGSFIWQPSTLQYSGLTLCLTR